MSTINILEDKVKTCRENLKKISVLENKIQDYEMKNLIMSIVERSVKITRTATQNDVFDLRNFFEYYIPQVIKILEAYSSAIKSGITSTATENFKDESKKIIINTNEALNKILENLLKKDFDLLRAEMKVLDDDLKNNGLVQNENFKMN